MSIQARSPSFRKVLTGRSADFRPPWSSETSIKSNCTSCSRCIEACPEAILKPGPGNTPVVDFNAGACTFCKACAEACPEPVFSDTSGPPWALVAQISDGCMLSMGIGCQLCTDICDRSALRLDLRVRPVGRIAINQDACTGCGACLPLCPTDAITLGEHIVEAGHEG
ncbi:ferredoxin-type protein NapF [Tropicibacter sp. R16_0]|uniref:ferredoxin-type protein NapF n=1 Tax=Tropicibacter sp. R16_0 TaxID=2821102 RepID=UPI001ADD5847|nr:ferredoxin-type protein NapF [Tropicibacter sp. R16_0]MBO9452729.1 ferredoxin-type protein NapF [Tropicibacter sp. R16_0]